MMFFFKQKTAYEIRISDWSSDVCSSDLCPASCRGLAVLRRDVELHRRLAARHRRLDDDVREIFGDTDIALQHLLHHRLILGDPAHHEFEQVIETAADEVAFDQRSEEHTSELQSLMRISYAVFCLKKKKNTNMNKHTNRAM